MFTISVEAQFQASKEPLHRHDWMIVIKVSSEKLDSMGLVMDFGQLKAMVNEITSGLNGARLDDVSYFHRNNSSAENVAKYIFDELEPKLPGGVELRSVKVVEEPGCSARFSR
jgi:6-pyruvoyltetrahydropterin/6-carboxytetrahydropterin synthase